MFHVYIFDYSDCGIYHCTIENPDEIENILVHKYNFRIKDIYYMISEKELKIQEI